MIYQQRPLRSVMDERIRRMPLAKRPEPMWKSALAGALCFAAIVAAVLA